MFALPSFLFGIIFCSRQKSPRKMHLKEFKRMNKDHGNFFHVNREIPITQEKKMTSNFTRLIKEVLI